MELQAVKIMIEQINKVTTSWLQTGSDGLLRFVDPLDREEISAHYGATHTAAAWIIYGQRINDIALERNGISLLSSVLDRWNSSIKLPTFHFDFNNFALCVACESLELENNDLCERIKKIVLTTPDSNNPTINWYPMRWYVNSMRYKWTGEEKYRAVCDICKKRIQEATFSDGFIDDFVPKGKSFNLQYDLATVAVMQFLRVHGEEIDISKELGALLNVVSPDGDINYLGRGTNQIFAWGLWIYLLASTGRNEVVIAVKYLQDRLGDMLENNNMMLNSWPGKEKYMWWDYHYCSVYTAHLLFWLVLAYEDVGKAKIDPHFTTPCDSGIQLHRLDRCLVVTFGGRKEYLAEKGPSVALLWTKKDGVIIKGCFAPWQGKFGNDYAIVDTTLKNYFGLLSVKQNPDFSRNRYIHKLLPNLRLNETETVNPLFVPVKIVEREKRLEVIWKTDGKGKMIVNVPVAGNCQMECLVDGEKTDLLLTAKIRNQYCWVDLWQSRQVFGCDIRLCIDL